MRNPKMMKRVSVKCAAAIMTAVMTMSPVAGAVAMPLVAYAADYNTTEDVPVDNENHRNLAVGDNLATNTGIIHENNGTIEVNMPGASVEENNNVVEDNYGDVDNSNTGRVETNHVGGQVHDGNVTDNYGTADSSVNVENNYAGATVSGNDNIVTNNWGTVTGVNQVTNNMGTVTGETVNVANNYAGGTVNNVAGTGEGPAPASGKATDPAPNPPAAPAPQVAPEPAAPAPEPEPEPAPEPDPEPAPAMEQMTPRRYVKNNPYANDPGGRRIAEALMGDKVDSAMGKETSEIILIDFGTNTGISETTLEALLTYNPDADNPVKKPILLSFTIDGLTYYLRVERNNKQLTSLILKSRLQGKKEGPMKIAELFGDYGITLVPSADAVQAHMDLVIKDLEDIREKVTPLDLQDITSTLGGAEDKIEIGIAMEDGVQAWLTKAGNTDDITAIDQIVGVIQNKVDACIEYNNSTLRSLREISDRLTTLTEQSDAYSKNLESLMNRRAAAEEKLKAVHAELQAAKAGSIEKDGGDIEVMEDEIAVLQDILQDIDIDMEERSKVIEEIAALQERLTTIAQAFLDSQDEIKVLQGQLDTITKAAAARKEQLALDSLVPQEVQNEMGAEQYGEEQYYGAAAAEQKQKISRKNKKNLDIDELQRDLEKLKKGTTDELLRDLEEKLKKQAQE